MTSLVESLPTPVSQLQTSLFLGILNSFCVGFNFHLDILIVKHPLAISPKGGLDCLWVPQESKQLVFQEEPLNAGR